MEFTHVLLAYAAIAAILSTCLSLPINKEEDSDTEIQVSKVLDLPKDVISEVLKETFSQVDVEVPNVMMSDKDIHTIVKRSKRAGVITGSKCPMDYFRLPSGECIPCTGLQNGECGEDYEDDDNEVE